MHYYHDAQNLLLKALLSLLKTAIIHYPHSMPAAKMFM